MSGAYQARMLKRVMGGYIFQPPPGIFCRTQAYRVNEAQKAEILALAQLEKVQWARWLTRIALALAVATGIAFRQAAGEPLVNSWLAGFSVFVIAQAIAASVTYYAVARRLQPLLAGLPRSAEQLYPAPIMFRRPELGSATVWYALLASVPIYMLLLHPDLVVSMFTTTTLVFILAAALLRLALAPFLLAVIHLRRQRHDQAALGER